MRALAGALSIRGKSFLAAGCAAVACGLALGQSDVLRVGILLLLLPLLAALTAGRARYRLGCTRRLLPSRIQAGQAAEVRLTVSNMSRSRTGLLLGEDMAPDILGRRARFTLGGIAAGGGTDVSYQVRPAVRGKFTIGPFRVRIADAFGMVEIARSFSSRSTLVVTPPITPLPVVTMPGSRLGDGDTGIRTAAAAGEDDVAPRAYRDGDELRRVNWKSTARYGELMVRREEQQWLERTCLFLDTRRRAHAGRGAASSFEYAIAAAASIGVHLAARGTQMRLVTENGEVTGAGTLADGLLDMLAVIQASRAVELSDGLTALRDGGHGQVIAVLGALSPAQARQLAASHRGPAPAMALLLGVADWGSGQPRRGGPAGDGNGSEAAPGAQILAGAGWRVSVATDATPLAAAWQDLHSPAARVTRASGTAR